MEDETICEECEDWIGSSVDLIDINGKYMCQNCAKKHG